MLQLDLNRKQTELNPFRLNAILSVKICCFFFSPRYVTMLVIVCKLGNFSSKQKSFSMEKGKMSVGQRGRKLFQMQ